MSSEFTKCIAQLLYMVASYRRRGQSELAVAMLQDIITLKNEKESKETKRLRAICLYNLAEAYQDIEPNNSMSRDLYDQAADLWNSIESQCKLSLLWHFSAMQRLQEETDRLILAASHSGAAQTDRDIAC